MRLPDPAFWRGRRVFVTGHSGFKGSWLTFWLHRLGAKVTGYALPPQTDPSAFTLLRTPDRITSVLGDVRDLDALRGAMHRASPEIVLHLAAQPLVLRSYNEPVGTFETNVMGTVNVLESAREAPDLRAIVVVTTDKVYAEDVTGRPYVEGDALGGPEPYSASKACAEIVTGAYREAFLRECGIAIATVRAGNVIGGGDWSADRLIPDIVAALRAGTTLALRHPGATRPWQHVLDPLSAYLIVAERLAAGDPVGRAWNIGPDPSSVATVADVLTRFERAWGAATAQRGTPTSLHEAPRLLLDSTAARVELDWAPRLDLNAAVQMTAEWYRAHADGESMIALTANQIDRYVSMDPPVAAGVPA